MSSFSPIVALGGLLCLIAITRSAYRVLYPHAVDEDAYAHLLYIQDIRTSGHCIPANPSKIEMPAPYGYPFLMHFLLSFLPETTDEIVERWFSPLMDLLLAGLVLLLVPMDVVQLPGALLGVGLILTTAQLIRFDQPHGTGLSARKPGLFFVSIYGFSLILWLTRGAPQWFLIATLALLCVCLTSKFGLQSGLILTVGVVFFDLSAVGPLLLGWVAAILVTGGKYWELFWSQVQHLTWYATVGQYDRFSHSWTGNVQSEIVSLRSPRDVARFIYYHRPIMALLYNPVVLLFALYLVAGWQGFISLRYSDPYFLWTGSLVVAFVATSLPHLKFLGEPARYLEYALLPTTVLTATLWEGSSLAIQLAIVGVLILGSIAVVGNIIAIGTWASPEKPDMKALIDWLSDQERGNVLVSPRGENYEIAYRTPHTVIDLMLNKWSPEIRQTVVKFTNGTDRKITNDVEWLDEMFGPDYVVFRDDRYESGELHPPDKTPAFLRGKYTVYRWEDVFRANEPDN